MNSQRISFLSLVKNCNHKGLGIYYLLSAFIFGISGTLISVLIRIELYSSGNRIISPENQNFYNISITLHGFLMIFFLVMPDNKHVISKGFHLSCDYNCGSEINWKAKEKLVPGGYISRLRKQGKGMLELRRRDHLS